MAQSAERTPATIKVIPRMSNTFSYTNGSRLEANTFDNELVTAEINLRAEKLLGEPGVALDMLR